MCIAVRLKVHHVQMARYNMSYFAILESMTNSLQEYVTSLNDVKAMFDVVFEDLPTSGQGLRPFTGIFTALALKLTK